MLDTEKMLLHAEGVAFKPGKHDLRCVERILSNYRKLIDAALPFAFGQNALSQEQRDNITYQVCFKEGSLDTWLEFVVENQDLIAGLISVDNGRHIALAVSQLLESILKFRKILDLFREKGETPKLQPAECAPNSATQTISISNVTTNGGNIYVTPIIIPAAEATRSAYDGLINTVDGKKVKQLTLSSGKVKSPITAEDRRLTGVHREQLPNLMDIIGRLDAVSISRRRGYLISSEVKYPICWPDELRCKIVKLVDVQNAIWKVRPIVDHKRFKNSPVAFQVLDCSDPQLKLGI